MKWYFTGQWTDGAGRAVKVAPIQITQSDRAIPLEVAAEAWKEYDAQGHGSQSLERLCQRGGFSASELAILLYERIKRIESPRMETRSATCDQPLWEHKGVATSEKCHLPEGHEGPCDYS